MPAMAEERRLLMMGRITAPHGVQGWLKLHSYARPIEAVFDYRPWLLRHRGEERELAPVEWRAQGKGLALRLPGIDDRSGAEAMIGAEIWVPRDRLPRPRPGEYYWADLEGLAVETTEGVALGRVSHLLETGANDVLVVQGERERLVPFVMGRHVMSVDLDAGRIVVDWDPEF